MSNPKPYEGHTPLRDERFWSRVDKRGPDECWPWTATTTGGYGTIGGKRATHLALEVRGVARPEWANLVRHHCDNPICVNPAHLAWGTHKENAADAVERKRHHSTRKTHCNHGHPFAGDNLIERPNGQRDCRECQRNRSRQWRRDNYVPAAYREQSNG